MKLTHANASPFVRKVMVVLHEANQLDAVDLIDGFGSPVAPSANALDANPTGRIPCLILDSGMSIYDSRVITRYLNKRFDLGLYQTGDKEFATLVLEAHVDAILDSAVLCSYEMRCRGESERSQSWLIAHRDKIKRGLDAIEQIWMQHLNGSMDITHIGVGCALGYLDFRAELGGWEDWRNDRSELQSWYVNFCKRPSMQATAPS